MNEQVLMDQPNCSEESTEILAEVTLPYEGGVLAGDADDCPRYGCTCINFEKCAFFGC